jgi:hypothetical protein
VKQKVGDEREDDDQQKKRAQGKRIAQENAVLLSPLVDGKRWIRLRHVGCSAPSFTLEQIAGFGALPDERKRQIGDHGNPQGRHFRRSAVRCEALT